MNQAKTEKYGYSNRIADDWTDNEDFLENLKIISGSGLDFETEEKALSGLITDLNQLKNSIRENIINEHIFLNRVNRTIDKLKQQ